ncbi:hypothetical protein HPB47_002227 [Ixodes persulcatus]|uniref:Uncharacterized protein n=1 Tax=Ixodes persulcatus TaxID=34615 RepID=A0AC60PLV3_IXOPE|nr:hypothetical protein HPB47_002227 [Ixodes persulcatus]
MACDRNPVAKCAAESDRGEKKSSPLDVIHKPRESLLSSSEPTTNYKGLVSFCVVIVGEPGDRPELLPHVKKKKKKKKRFI